MYLIIWCELESSKSNTGVSLDYLIQFQGFYIKYIFVCWFFLFVSLVVEFRALYMLEKSFTTNH